MHDYLGRRNFALNAWLLSGLLLAVGFLKCAPSSNGGLASTEDRVVAIDFDVDLGVDVKSELLYPDLALDILVGDFSSPQRLSNVQNGNFSQPGQVRLRSHNVRGPPLC